VNTVSVVRRNLINIAHFNSARDFSTAIIGDARPTPRSHSAVIGYSPLSNIEQISIQLRCNISAGRVSNWMGNLMPESQPTVYGKRPLGMREPRAFGVEDRPPCPFCGADTHLFRRSPEPVYHGYEVQIFSCMKCDAEITRSADRKGKPHPPAVLIDLEEPQGIARGMSE
jgi:hypothetical protein